jgi:CubicO group peptidase (beta-lactamase class C family)
MRSLFLEFVFSSAIALCLFVSCTENNVLPQNTEISKLFRQWDNDNTPGCAVAVIKDGSIIHSAGYGMADLEHDIPIIPGSVFYVGSVSKQFVAACVLLLEEEGRLSLDDNIRKYLPEFPDYGTPITIRHLIHHTSGIKDYLSLWEQTGRSYLDYMDENEVYKMICAQDELNFKPGEKHRYSNSCYFLLWFIIERASGTTLKQYARDNIFEPLGMNKSHFHDNYLHIIKDRAIGYERLEDGSFGNLYMRFDLVGSGGLYTTVEDLYKWDQNFYDNKLGKSGQALIDTMLTNGRLNNGTEINYAFALVNDTYRGARVVRHTGSLGGYRAVITRFPDQKFSVIILSNLANFEPLEIAYNAADIVLKSELE